MTSAQRAWHLSRSLYDDWSAGTLWKLCRVISGSRDAADAMWSDISDSVRGYWKHRKAMSRSHWIGMVMLAVNQATAGCRPIPARWSERIVRDNGAAKVLDLCDPPPPKESVSDQPTFFVRQRVLCLQIAEECGVSITDLLIIESTQPNLC